MKIKKLQFILFCSLVLMGASLFAQKNVSGVVKDDEGQLLPGVSVIIQGYSKGVTTDFDGNYKITVPNEASVLIFSYLGMKAEKVTVGNQSVLNVTLKADSEELNEVVITALGISREKKSLGYSVAEVKGEAMSLVPQENALNALNGRVAGVQINSTGGPGSTVSVILRGASSLTTDNQPLYIIDGVPLTSGLSNVGSVGKGDVPDYGGGIADLNPNDIAEVSVLKGPSAAALYGARGGNGVILITTKSGKNSKGLGVSFSTSNVFKTPYKFLNKTVNYANGNRPDPSVKIIPEYSKGGVGIPLDQGYSAVQWPYTAQELQSGVPVAKPLISRGKHNAKNFFQTASTRINTLSIKNSTDMFNYRLSYTNMKSNGYIPNSDRHRDNFSLNGEFKVNDKLKIKSNLNYVRTGAKNVPSTTDRDANPLQALYTINPHIDIRDMRNYWLVKGKTQNDSYTWGSDPNDISSYRIDNPYFLAYEINNGFDRRRFFGNLQADYKFTSNLSLMAAFTYNDSNEERTTKISSGYTNAKNGAYGVNNLQGIESNAKFLLSYTKRLNNNWSFGLSGGGNTRNTYNSYNGIQTKNGGSGLVIPNVFSVNNIANSNLQVNQSHSKVRMNSFYALGNVNYKEMIYLDATARNDWSSTLPLNNNSFFYPSVSSSWLLNKMFKMGHNVSLFKIRAGWAQAGRATSAHNLTAVINSSTTNWGSAIQLAAPGQFKDQNIKPEMNTSLEYGTDISLFKNRLYLNATYYNSVNRNQIFKKSLPLASGATSKVFNAGSLTVKGFEANFGGTPIVGKDFKWNLNFTFTKTRTRVTSLADGTNYVQLWQGGRGGAYSWVGDRIGQLVDRKFVRVEDKNSPYYGWPLLDKDGWEQSDKTLSDKNGNRVAPVIGNYNPNFKIGMQTSIKYKRFNLSMNFDWRNGGKFESQTFRYFESDLQGERWVNRVHDLSHVGNVSQYVKDHASEYLSPNGEFYPLIGGPTKALGGFPLQGLNDGVFLPGVIGSYDANGNFVATQENVGGPGTKYHQYGDNYPWSFIRPATFAADYVKLRQISLGYTLPNEITRKIGLRNLSIAVYSQNIILWTKAKIGIDPESAFQSSGGTLHQGTERYNIQPWSIPVGLKLNVSF